MNILHLQLTGNPGGIVSLCRDYANNSNDNNIIYFLFSGGIVADRIKSEGHQVVINEYGKKYWIKSAQRLNLFCKENDVDVIINHSNAPISIFATSYVVRRNKNIKWLMYFHSDPEDMTIKQKILYRPFIQYQIKHSDARLAISKCVKESAIRLFNIKPSKVEVVYNGVDIAKFKKKSINPVDKVRFIYVGRLFPAKGVHILIEAINQLNKCENVMWTIVGDGPQKNELEQMVHDLKLDDKVEFLGSRLDVPELLLEADYFIHPAIWNEGFGITLIEAMSVGLPCVAFNRGAMPEIISDNINGFIINEINANSLADGMIHCINIRNTEKYLKMVDDAICTAERFSIANMVKNLENIIERC